MVPFSQAEREQLADEALDRVFGPAPVEAPLPSERRASPVAAPRPRSGARAVWMPVAAALALAAAVALYFVEGRRAVEPLAAYSLTVAGEQSTRGAPASDAPGEPVRLRPGTRLVLTLQADKPERDALLRLVLVRGGRATLLDPPVTRGKGGAFTIEGAAAELLGSPGDGAAELVVVLGRALPSDEEIRALSLGAPRDVPRHLQMKRRAIVLEGFSHTTLDVLIGGCRAVRRAPARPTCEVEPGAPLRVWLGATAATTALRIDEHALDRTGEARDGGTAFTVDPPAGARSLSVWVDGAVVAAWDLARESLSEPVRASDEARKAGRLDEASAALDAVPAGAPPEEQLEVVRRRAKIARRRGDGARERALREEAVARAIALGRVSAEMDESLAITFGLIGAHALAEAAQRLPALDAHGAVYAEGLVRRDLARGLVASELGDLGVALTSLRRALTAAERIGDALDREAILAPLSDVLQSLGRGAEAHELIEAGIARGERAEDACTRVEALASAAWLLRDLDPPRARRLSDEAADLAAARCAPHLSIALVNRGWLLAAAGRAKDARAVLDRIAAAKREQDGRATTWALRLEAEILLGEDAAMAERRARDLAARAASLCSTELSYEAHLLHARAQAALDRPLEAAAAFADAERALDLWSRLVPLGEGREAFFARHDQLALTAIPFFLERAARGEPGARANLAATVRRSIARFVSSLAGAGRARALAERGDAGEAGRDRAARLFEQTRDRWPARLSRGEGAKADTGKAVAGVCEARDAAAVSFEAPALTAPPLHPTLLVHPGPRGVLTVVWRGSSIEIGEVPRLEAPEAPAALAARIADTVAPWLAGAPRVHVHAHRALASAPLDRSLAARLQVPVAFAVDAPPRAPSAACTGAPRALLVTNPRSDLWGASSAAPSVRADLARMGFTVDALEGAAATRAAIVRRLADPCTALLHYDGHGLAPAGGASRDRADDALLLAAGDVLTAADVLELPRVPAAVVLNGCTTAAPEGLGLAHAFLLAGAVQVIASLDDLPAAAAADFTTRLFERASPALGLDLVSLFARTVTTGGEVTALRVFER
ncbi:Exonuclease SbcC [Minicystis rosea]|nr:Exonuclease SbcC [Minicystis rosea]